MDSCLYAGLRWLVTSEIQSPSGGVCFDYSSLDRKHGAVTTESTSWYIRGLLGLSGEVDDDRRLRAERAGRFLMERAFDLSSDLFLHETQVDDTGLAPKQAEFVSCGLAVDAMTALWRATSEYSYLDCAERCASAMLLRMHRVDGSFSPLYDIVTQQAALHLAPAIDQLKVAMIFRSVSEAGGRGEFVSAADLMGAWALRREQLEWAGVDRAASLRRYALFLEGLLPNASRDIGYGRALQSGLLRLESEFDASPLADRRPSLLARLLRLRLYADSLGIIELDHSRAEFEAARVAEHQIQSSDPQLDGAFGAEPPETDVEMPAVVDPETAVVCLQALEMWRQVQDGGFRRGWHELI